MSRTFRYDPEAGRDGGGRLCRGREAQCFAEEDSAEDVGAASDGEASMGGLTMEWAVEAMSRRIGRMVDFLVRGHYIGEGEREDYKQEFNLVVCRAMSSYRHVYDDPRVRVFAAKAFLRKSLDNAMKQVKMHIHYRNSRYREIPLAATPEEAHECAGGAVWVEDESLSDKYSSMEDLVLDMDKDTMRDMLANLEERLCFDLKCAEHSDSRIAEVLSWLKDEKVDRHHVAYVLMKKVRDVVRRCGYAPKTELPANRSHGA